MCIHIFPLLSALKNGVRKAPEVYRDAEAEGLSDRTLKRACVEIGVLKFKKQEGWFWQHPDDQTPIPDAARELNKEAQVRRSHQQSTRDVRHWDEPEISSVKVQ